MSPAFVALAWWSVLAAAPEASLPRAVVMDVQALEKNAEAAKALTGALTATVTTTRLFRVLSAEDVRALLGFERQRQLLGCDDGGAQCLTELTDAMGADLVVTATLAQLGEVYQFTVQGLDPKQSRVIGRATRMARDLGTLRAALPYMVSEATGTPAPPEPSRLGPGLLVGVGAAAVVAGGVLFLQAALLEQSTSAELLLGQQQPQVSLKSLDWYRAQAQSVETLRIIGGVSAGVGVAMAVTGALLFPRGVGGSVAARVAPMPNGFAVVGVWP